MSKFKVGCKVRVVDARGCNYFSPGDILTIQEIKHGYLYFVGITLAGWSCERFELVEEEPPIPIPSKEQLIESAKKFLEENGFIVGEKTPFEVQNDLYKLWHEHLLKQYLHPQGAGNLRPWRPKE